MPSAISKKEAESGPGSQLRFGLDELQTFLVVAELGSFSRAAEKLNLSQPSVTGRIQRLEVMLGVKLLARTTRQVVPTEHGERLRRSAEKALRELRRVVEEFQEAAEKHQRTVTIAVTPMLAAVVMPSLIGRFARENPRVAVRMHDLTIEGTLNEVRAGRADLAVMVLEDPPPPFVFESLTVDECVLVTSLDHRFAAQSTVSLQDVAREQLLIHEVYTTVRQSLEAAFTSRGLSFQPLNQGRQVMNFSTLIGMAAAGLGVAVVPRTLISKEMRSKVGLARIVDVSIRRNYGIVTVQDRPLQPPAKIFVRFLKSVITDPTAGWPI